MSYKAPSGFKVEVEGYGKQLGIKDLNFIIREKEQLEKKIPFHAIKEIVIPSGNSISTKALAWASIYGTKIVVTSQSSRPLGVFLPLNYDMHVNTRIKQYQAYSEEKGICIAKDLLKNSSVNVFL